MATKLKPFPADPLPPSPRTPRCEANVSKWSTHEEEWRTQRYGKSDRPLQCSRESVVEIEGKHYCRIHGGYRALDMLLEGKLVEKNPKRPKEKCGICGGEHDNDALTDICKACELRLEEEGSP